MEALVFLALLLSIVGGSDGAWCVCRPDAGSSAQQKTIDYACGAGADCSQINQNGNCYNPNTVLTHCSYAANSYYQKKGQAQGACDFSGTATLTTTDPSANGCAYPASASAAGTSTTTPTTTPGTSTTTPTTTPGTSTTTPTTTPGTTTPNTYSPTTGTGMGTGTGTGVLGGLGPSGNSISTDTSAGGIRKAEMASVLLTILFSSMAVFRS